MSQLPDINCDYGENFGVYQLTDISSILSYVTSVNIACGFHAGDPSTMRIAVEQALQNKVKIGAHPGYPDLVGFGRREMMFSPEEIYNLITYQIGALSGFLNKYGEKLHHVKLHGALYNQAAKSEEISKAFVQAVYDFSPEIKLYALANSVTVKIGEEAGLAVWEEAFIDRTYESDGSLSPRNQNGSVITNEETALKQVLKMVHEQKVTATNGEELHLNPKTLCIHGDQENAIPIARRVYGALHL